MQLRGTRVKTCFKANWHRAHARHNHSMYPYIFSLHVLAATVWTGGHLVLALAVLPRVLREKSVVDLQRFESAYERVGMPALAIQLASGLWMAHTLVPDITTWFTLETPLARAVALKLLLLLATALIALHARLRVIPRLSSQTLGLMAWHIAAVTVLSVVFVLTGVAFRYGGLG